MKKQLYIQLSEEQFEKGFELVKNPFDPSAGWEGCLFETYGLSSEYILAQDPAHIWTLLESDTGLTIVSGYHIVDRLNHIVSIEPVPGGVTYIVEL